MIQAILEIAVMLLVAVGIGIFFTNRYWKAKYDEAQRENEELSKKVNELGSEVESLGADVVVLKKKYEADLSAMKEEFDQRVEQANAASAEATKENESLKKENKKLDSSLKKQKKDFEHELELKDEALGEKEREIEHLSKEMHHHQVSYYKQIDGKRYKAVTIEKANDSVSGKGDGRISKADAMEIFATISDGHQYTQVEKDTMYYLRHNYKWTPEADDLFRTKVRSWAAKGHNLD